MVADRAAWYCEYIYRSPDSHRWKIGVADKSTQIHEPAFGQKSLTKGLTQFHCFGGGQISDECQPKLTSHSGHHIRVMSILAISLWGWRFILPVQWRCLGWWFMCYWLYVAYGCGFRWWYEVQMKMKFRAAFLGLNYIATVVASLTILFSEQFSFGEKAVYGTSAILIGMAIRNFVQTRIPIQE